jgi:hypothetical protein
MGGKAGEEITNDVIVDYRLKNGLCHGCGARIYDISNGRVSPITIKGVVSEGRCLFCYPDTDGEKKKEPKEEPKEETKDKEKRRADKTKSSDKKKPFRRRLRSAPEHSPSTLAIKEEAADDPDIKEKNVDDGSDSYRDASTDTSVARLPQKPTTKSEETDSSDDEQVKTKTHASIEDIEGNIYHGTVTKGSTQKGSGSFRFVYSTGPNKGKDSTYEGEFENGHMEGHGTSRDAVCCVYKGEYHKGAAHGKGACSWAGGWKYDGEWRMDEREGHGKLWQDVKDGEVYEGEWKDDQWHGMGELKFSVGGRYVGGFKHHLLDGEGRVRSWRQRCECI